MFMGCAVGWATHSHCYADKGSVCFVVWDKQIYRRVHAMKPVGVKGFGGLKTTAHITWFYLMEKGVRGQIGYLKNKLFLCILLFYSSKMIIRFSLKLEVFS